MMVSRCCSADLEIHGHVMDYYVCVKCSRPTDARLSFQLDGCDKDNQNDSERF